MRAAAAVASAPPFRKRTISQQGTISCIRSAHSISRGLLRPQMMPLANCSRMASSTAG
jgi:hypothetical protein